MSRSVAATLLVGGVLLLVVGYRTEPPMGFLPVIVGNVSLCMACLGFLGSFRRNP